jgi:hypothetical protein
MWPDTRYLASGNANVNVCLNYPRTGGSSRKPLRQYRPVTLPSRLS